MTLSLGEVGVELAAGSSDRAEDVRRCLACLYGTRPGEQALDREFGITAEALGRPLAQAQSLLTAEIIRKTARYEPRARVVRVEWMESETDKGVLQPKVVICVE